MRAVLDACVLYPTVLREILLGVARARLIAPVWSPLIAEEWRRAALKNGGAVDGALAEGEIARANAAFPGASIAADPGGESGLWLPDAADIHVLATAIAGQAEVIVTFNLRDFPLRELSGHGIAPRHPDALLYGLWLDHPEEVGAAVAAVHSEAARLSPEPLGLRSLLKRGKLPRLGKALG